MYSKQNQILDYLLDHPDGATLDELSAYLKITKTAVKEHIIKMGYSGHITHVDSAGKVGRPRRRYLLTKEGHEVFPRQYSWLSNVLLELLSDDFGSEEVSRIMRSLAKKVANSMTSRLSRIQSSPELLSEITKILNELGYRASLKQSDLRKGAIIEATNCVYHNVAKQHPNLCQFDVHFIKNTSNMEVTLESCIARGGSVCRFCIQKNKFNEL